MHSSLWLLTCEAGLDPAGDVGWGQCRGIPVVQPRGHARSIVWGMRQCWTEISFFAHPCTMSCEIMSWKVSITAPVAWKCLKRVDSHDTACSQQSQPCFCHPPCAKTCDGQYLWRLGCWQNKQQCHHHTLTLSSSLTGIQDFFLWSLACCFFFFKATKENVKGNNFSISSRRGGENVGFSLWLCSDIDFPLWQNRSVEYSFLFLPPTTLQKKHRLSRYVLVFRKVHIWV